MTWRERIAEARARGTFSLEDRRVWASAATCLIGEAAGLVGWGKIDRLKQIAFPECADGCVQPLMYEALMANDADGLEALLERIEDAVLQVKREQAT